MSTVTFKNDFIPEVPDSNVSVCCRFLDKLGMTAQNNIDVVVRESLVGTHSHYSVIDNDFTPLPVWACHTTHKGWVITLFYNIYRFRIFGSLFFTRSWLVKRFTMFGK